MVAAAVDKRRPLPAAARVATLRALRTLLAKGLVQRRQGKEGALWAHKARLAEELARAAAKGKKAEREQRKLDAAHAAAGLDEFPKTMQRLAKLLGLLRSDHDHEMLAAARQAEALRQRLRLEWSELLTDRELFGYRLRRSRKRWRSETLQWCNEAS